MSCFCDSCKQARARIILLSQNDESLAQAENEVLYLINRLIQRRETGLCSPLNRTIQAFNTMSLMEKEFRDGEDSFLERQGEEKKD